MKKWTDTEIDFLRRNANVAPIEEISKTLNRTISAIYHKAEILKIKLTRERSQLLVERNFKHGFGYSNRLYRIWKTTRERCNYKKHVHYKYYGERGIKVCKEWQEHFMSFYTWAMSNGYQDGLTIDRIDNNGNYEPSNCRWITMKEQCNNRSSNKIIAAFNESKTAADWEKDPRAKVNAILIKSRIIHGWNSEEAIITGKFQ